MKYIVIENQTMRISRAERRQFSCVLAIVNRRLFDYNFDSIKFFVLLSAMSLSVVGGGDGDVYVRLCLFSPATSSSHCTTANKLLLWKLFSRKSLLGFKLSFICCKSFCSQMRYIYIWYIWGEKQCKEEKKHAETPYSEK